MGILYIKSVASLKELIWLLTGFNVGLYCISRADWEIRRSLFLPYFWFLMDLLLLSILDKSILYGPYDLQLSLSRFEFTDGFVVLSSFDVL